MNVIKRELTANRNSLLTWCISMVFLIYAGMIKYAGFAQAGQQAREFVKQLPPAFQAALGLGGLDISTAIGYYAVFYLYLLVLAGIHAIMLGATIIAKEERDKTADFLFAKPRTRTEIITSKLLAALINIVVLNLITTAASLYFMSPYKGAEPVGEAVAKLMVPLFIVQIIFIACGALLGAAARNVKKATSLAAALIMATFLISIAIDLYPKISFLRYITPFKYFPALQVLKSGSYDLQILALSAVLAITAIAFTYRILKRRDIRI